MYKEYVKSIASEVLPVSKQRRKARRTNRRCQVNKYPRIAKRGEAIECPHCGNQAITTKPDYTEQCMHDERDHGICLDCGDEQDPGEAIDRAMDYFEGDR